MERNSVAMTSFPLKRCPFGFGEWYGWGSKINSRKGETKQEGCQAVWMSHTVFTSTSRAAEVITFPEIKIRWNFPCLYAFDGYFGLEKKGE